MTAPFPAGLTLVSAALLAVAGFAGGWIVTAAAGVCVLALAAGWGELLRLPHRSGTAFLVGLLGVAALVGGTLAVWPRTAVDRPLEVFAAVLAGAMLTSFGHELVRQDGRANLVESITGTLAGQTIAVLAAGWVLLAYTRPGSSAIVVTAVAVAVAKLADTLPLGPLTAWIPVALGLVGAVVASLFVTDMQLLTAATVGISVSIVGIAVDRLIAPAVEPGGFDVSVLARAAAPVAAAGTVAYAVVRLGIG